LKASRNYFSNEENFRQIIYAVLRKGTSVQNRAIVRRLLSLR